jgi:hypothetical protein
VQQPPRRYSQEDANSVFDFAEWGFRPPIPYQRDERLKRRAGGRRLTVKDLLDHDLLRPGAVLQPAPKAIHGIATVGASGEIIVGAVPYKTPSGAAKAANGRRAESGWDFWRVIDEGASLADLRIRLRALSRSCSPIAEKFHGSIGGGLYGHYIVEADGRDVIWLFVRAGNEAERHEVTPTPEEWVRFWDELDRAGIWQWNASYETEGVIDGTDWHVIARYDGKRVESSGANGYPGSLGPEPGRTFTTFCRAVAKLSRHDFR